MEDFWNFALESGSLTIASWIFIVVIVIGIMGIIGWWGFKKLFVYKYNFAVISHTGKVFPKKARIVQGENGINKFEIDGHSGQLLDIKDANGKVDGKPSRIVAFDGMGHLVYCKDFKDEKSCEFVDINSKHAKVKVDKSEYYETALLPIEREQVANNIIASTKKYGKMDPTFKWNIILSFILLIVIIVGVVIQGKMLGKQYDQSSQDIEVQRESTKSMEKTAEIIAKNTDVQLIILGRVLDDANLTKNLTFSTIAK